jgi:hypothetical protein
MRKYSFAVRVVEPWNQLPDSCQTGSRQGGIQESHEGLEELDKKQ